LQKISVEVEVKVQVELELLCRRGTSVEVFYWFFRAAQVVVFVGTEAVIHKDIFMARYTHIQIVATWKTEVFWHCQPRDSFEKRYTILPINWGNRSFRMFHYV